MVKKSLLHLTLHREFFEAIATGIKTTEFRDDTAYWRTRLEGRRYDEIIFRNGYGRHVPEMRVEFKSIRRIVRGGHKVFAIKLGRILALKRWKKK